MNSRLLLAVGVTALLITLTLLSAQQVCPFVFGGRNFGWHLAKRCCLRLCPHLACDSHSHDEERRALLAREQSVSVGGGERGTFGTPAFPKPVR